VQVNTTEVIDRNNRPNVSQRIGLRTFFMNDGAYVDPYEISSVQLFAESATLSPNSVLGDDNLVTAIPLMTFAASAPTAGGTMIHCTQPGATGPCEDAFDPDNYYPAPTASGIYRLSEGEYVVVLDQIEALSGWDYTTETQLAASSLSTVGDYVDLWAVKLNSASKYQIITSKFSLNEDTFFAFTEPLLLTTSNRLMNKHVRYGETIDIKVGTEVTIQNEDVTKSIQNIFKESVLTDAFITIKKVNQNPAFDGPFTVVPTTSLVGGTTPMDITGDNTLIYNWDTTTTIDAMTTQTFGSPTGTYSVQVKYTVLNQTIISPLFYLTVS